MVESVKYQRISIDKVPWVGNFSLDVLVELAEEGCIGNRRKENPGKMYKQKHILGMGQSLCGRRMNNSIGLSSKGHKTE